MEYQDKICGLHYKRKKFADKYHELCSTHTICNLEITKHSLGIMKMHGRG